MDDYSEKLIGAAFKSNAGLEMRIKEAARTFQNGIPELLRDISTFILTLQKSGQAEHHPAYHNEHPPEPTAKRRKLERGPEATERSMQGDNGSYEIATNAPRIKFECKDVSFTSPLRKKLKLQFVTDTNNTSKHQIRLLNQTTHAIEYTLRGEDVDAMFCLPVPEKTQRQQCFLIFPLPGSQSYDGTPAEPLVWTMNETKGSPEIVGGATRLDGSEEDTFVEVTRRELDSFMAALGRKTILPTEREFASEIPQSHRRNEKAFHTKAFRGSKEGYLYLLSTGIVFGFKKPVSYFPFSSIESISFTSVLQRTFNIVITTSNPDPDPSEPPTKETTHELSMVDQADFQPIDAYIRAHGLNDASMAAERRAKIHNVNKPAAGTGEDGAEGVVDANGEVDGRGEIEKAEAMLQDQEDEEEEDYDPSGGESEGSGEDSDGEEGVYEDGDGEGEGEEEEWDEEEEGEEEEEEEVGAGEEA